MQKKLAAIAKKYSLKLIILFGSADENRQHKKSDIDVAVVLSKPIFLRKELDLRSELFKIFKKEIDLVQIQHAGPLLLGQIAKKGKLLYGNKKDFSALRIYAQKCFLDFEPYFKLREQIINRKLSV